MAGSRASGIFNLAEMAEDRLWERRLDKKYQDMQEKVDSITAKRDKDIDNILQKCQPYIELYESVLVRIEKLEREVADHNRSIDGLVEEMKQTEESLRSRVSDEEIESVESAPIFARASSSSYLRALDHVEDEARIAGEFAADSMHTRPPLRPANRKSSYIPLGGSQPPISAVIDQQNATPFVQTLAIKELFKIPSIPVGPGTFNFPANNRKRPTAARPPTEDQPRLPPMVRRNRSRSTSGELGAKVPIVTHLPKIPKLSQLRRPLIVYYEDSTEVYNSLGLEAGQPEFDFVSSWIAGITSKKTAEKLVDSLASFCPCDTNEDGSREIFCEWHEVMEGMKNAGLDVAQHGGQDKGKAQVTVNSMPTSRNFKAGDDPYSAGKSVATNSRGGRQPQVANNVADVTERHEVEKHGERPEPISGRSSRIAVNKPKPNKARSGGTEATSGSSRAKPATSSTGKAKYGQTAAERSGPNKSKAGGAASGISGPGTAPASGEKAGIGDVTGARRGQPRAAKRRLPN